jgi:hypothetical protein
MITAYQSAKLQSAKHVYVAVEEIKEALPLICMTQEDRQLLHSVLTDLHAVFAELIPNGKQEDYDERLHRR